MENTEQIIIKLNKSHAALMLGGKFTILTETINPATEYPEIQFSTVADIKNLYRNRKITRIVDDKVKLINPADEWLDHPDRRQYRGIVFTPNEPPNGYFNLWKGFATQPKQGDCSLYLELIKNIICDGDEYHLRWLLDWMADAVQNPGGVRPGTAVVLRGLQGTGKGVFATNFGKIFGSHFVHISGQHRLTGRFNNHLKMGLLVFVDEGFWAGDRRDTGTRPSKHNYNVHRKELSALFEYAIKHLRVVQYNPVSVLDQMPENPEPKDPPTEQQVLQLIAAADPETEKPVLLTVLFTAGRIDEILRMKWEDVNFEKRTVTLWTKKRKGGQYEADKLPMIEDLYEVLKREWDRRTQNLWVFFNEKTGTRYNKRPKMMKHLCMKVFDPGCRGLKHYKGPVFGFHALRHFMSTFLADTEKQSTKTVQKILRHKSPKTTERYMHSDDRNVVEAMKRIEGKFK
jgi:integrase